MGGKSKSSNYSSSSDEEEDPKWKAAIESIAFTTTYGSKVFGTSPTSNPTPNPAEADGEAAVIPRKLKLYEIKAQKLLDDILERTLEIGIVPILVPDNDPDIDGGGVRLFKKSPVGIVFDHQRLKLVSIQPDEVQRPRKRPRIVPSQGINEKSKKFKEKMKSVAVDGIDIMAAACDSGRKSLARLEAKEKAQKAKAKKEDERVAELKRVRGERWLPAIARELRLNRNSARQD
ncbi:hypothetical protein Tsubulata_001486 [Turnera subulata]|uniref:Uncharacterized protein n=1 Tax=Turnera subulata TaxID=218843 RepID=A0A9Q0F1T6_9ROSI|nr:hypothetical protein Tsubulata_001486 [Turnera subulata]